MKTIASVIDEIIKNYGWDEQFTLDKIRNTWNEVVGEKVASNADAQSFKNGTLYIQTTSSNWRSELFLRRAGLMEKINQKLGTNVVKSIYIK